MNTKMTVVVAAIVLCLGIAASAQTYNFTFTGYCDGMTLTVFKSGSGPKTLVDGTHNNYNCDDDNANVGGFKFTPSPDYQFDSVGPVLSVSDPALGLEGDNSSLTYNVNIPYGTWVLWEDGSIFNYGTLTFTADRSVKGAGAKSSLKR
jgi:hypothetical protein